MGLIVDNVHAVAADVVKFGCSAALFQTERILIEDDPETNAIKNFGIDLLKSHEGFAPMSNSIRFGSCSNSHFNHAICIGVYRVPTTYDKIKDSDGRVHSERLFKHPKMKEAAENGLEWTVFTYEFIKKFPRFPHFVQLMKNVESDAAKGENAFQGLLGISNLVKQFWNEGNPDMPKISRIMAKTSSNCVDDMTTMCEFVRVWGGGRDGTHIRSLVDFAKRFVPHGRFVPGATFEACNMLFKRLSEDELCPNYVTAVIMAQAKCPAAFVQSKACCFIKPADITKLSGSGKSDMIKAENLIKECKTIVQNANIDSVIVEQLKVTIMIKLARFVIGKQGNPVYESMEQLCDAFIEIDVNKHMPINDKMDSQWKEHRKIEKAKSCAVLHKAVVEHDEDGGIGNANAALFKKLNMQIGSTIEHRTNEQHYAQVVSLDDRLNTVGFAMIDKAGQVELDKVTSMSIRELNQSWKASKMEFTILDNKTPSETKEFMEHCVKSHIGIALHRANQAHQPAPDVRFHVKPRRAVFANTKFAAGKLTLIPMSTKVMCCADKDSQKLNASTKKMEVIMKPIGIDGYKFFISPMINKDFVAHFWGVQPTDIKKNVNMAIEHMDIYIQSRLTKDKHSMVDYVEPRMYTIPIMVNTKPINVNDELLYFMKKAEPEKINKKRGVMEAFDGE